MNKSKFLLPLLMAIFMMAMSPAKGWATVVSYRVPVYKTVGDPKSGIASWETKTVDATQVTSANESVTWPSGWYYVSGSDVKLTKGAVCSGDVHLILCDGAKLTVTSDDELKAGIDVTGANKLTIYADSENAQCNLTATVTGEYGFGAGIGGSEGSGSNITINGGTVTATGGSFCGAGIGGANDGDGSNITINGGTVKATGGDSSAGIGGANKGNGSNITINGGTVTATGKGAGIGGGYSGSGSGITINGGTITANGGKQCAGIGGGCAYSGSGITITGGSVTATGGEYAAGIGGGLEGNGSSITIKGGAVTATGGDCGNSTEVRAAGIGNGCACSSNPTNIIIGTDGWIKKGYDAKSAQEFGNNTGNDIALSIGMGWANKYADVHVHMRTASWTWAEDYSSAEAVLTCSLCNDVAQLNTSTTPSVMITSNCTATCTNSGHTYYKASVCYPGGVPYNAPVKDFPTSAFGHGTTGYTDTYTWSGECFNDDTQDTKKCSFTLKCNKCSTNVVEDISLDCTKDNHTDATCIAEGGTTYVVTGSFTSTNSNYNYSETKTHDYIIAALGHDYTIQTVSDTYKKSDATCTSKATYYYNCSRCSANETDANHTFTNGSALGHGTTGYTPAYTWGGTYDAATCIFTLQCKKCSTDVVSNASLTTTKVTASHVDVTCTTDGNERWKAIGSYSNSGDAPYTGTEQIKDYTIVAEGHANPEHYNDNGLTLCTNCGLDFGVYQPATLVNSVYEISNAGQLYWFANQANTVNLGIHGKLTKDITVNDGTFDENGKFKKTGETVESTPVSWTPIGGRDNYYTGTFDGDNHTISGLYWDMITRRNVGLFGNAKWGTIKKLGVINSYMRGISEVGILCGYSNCTIENCYTSGIVRGTYQPNGAITANLENIGGLCGANYGALTNCHSSCTVISDCKYTGGLCGYNGGTLAGCYATGNVTSTKSSTGGLCGYCDGQDNVSIISCYATGKITSTSGVVGGLCGYFNYGENPIKVKNCYTSADIEASGSAVGGLVGSIVADSPSSISIDYCYSTSKVGSGEKHGGIFGNMWAGTVANCYTNTSTEIGIGNKYFGNNDDFVVLANVSAGVPLSRFQSGEIAYLLNGSRNEGTDESPLVWGQVLEADATPTLNGGGVDTYKRTNIKNKWGTLVVPFDVAANVEEYDLYSISSADDDNLTLTKVDDILSAGTPVLIRMSEAAKDAETGKYNLILKAANATLNTSGTLTSASENVEGLTLKGSYDVKDITEVSGYIISNNAFWNIQTIKGENKVYNAPFRAYLAGSTSNYAKMLSIGWNDDEDITAVETLDALTSDEAQYFDINGRKLNDLQQGINIVKRGNKTYKIIVK